MKSHDLFEMVDDYQKITGETIDFNGFFFDGDLHDGQNKHFRFFPQIGFLFWGIQENAGVRYFSMLETYGKVSGMVDYIKSVMLLNGLTQILTMTTRNPKAHIRKWKMEHHQELDYDYDGRHYYVLTGNIVNLH